MMKVWSHDQAYRMYQSPHEVVMALERNPIRVIE